MPTKKPAPSAKKTTKPAAKAAAKPVAKPAQSAKSKPAAKAKPTARAKTAVKAKSAVKAKPAAKPSPALKAKSAAKPPSKSTRGFKPAKESADAKNEVYPLVKQEIAQKEMDLLCELYPDADCELTFETPFQLLIAVILSAQTTDVNVNKVTPNLFRRFPDAQALADASLDEIADIVRSTGFFNSKAKNIHACAHALVEKFNGEVPKTQAELTPLPGVGVKTANVVLGVCFGVPGWSVDTHVQRLSKRLGFSQEQDPLKIERDLQKLFPGQDWSKLAITMIWHGRRKCYARKPDCATCPVNQLCPASEVRV